MKKNKVRDVKAQNNKAIIEFIKKFPKNMIPIRITASRLPNWP